MRPCRRVDRSGRCLELAIIVPYMAAAAGFMHGAAMCQGEGVPIEIYTAQREAAFALTRDAAEAWLPRVERRDYADSEATMKCTPMEWPCSCASPAKGTDTSFPVGLHEADSRAVYHGHGEEDAAVMFDTFTSP
jgi:hypothetical protein